MRLVVLDLLDSWLNWNLERLVSKERGTDRSTQRKNSRSKGENQQEPQHPHKA